MMNLKDGVVRAPMPGKVLALNVREGQQVTKGAVILILEAMKMENEIKSPRDGTVKSIGVTVGQIVNAGLALAVVE